MTLGAAVEIRRTDEATSKHMKMLDGHHKSYQEARSIDSIRKKKRENFVTIAANIRNV